ncbi:MULTISPECIES: hypothetical protein [unclassified Arenibacter]|uniref:hypothetical protein n=1 Tax=unclassified Arenibacter TaxID=2615047 RepID=UPI000E34AB30|nr:MULTISPECIES: hypothetical protein [unclassified Arenibacter]MCM4165447.1 hypothetical protein [Arenibacter sp. A80]RFT54917.1 hypothetical protein D0S24_17755 [Arenibacter sp. P308M17]
MKLLIVTVVEEYAKEMLQLFKKANIESFSGSDIDGYKNPASVLMAANWFPTEKGGVGSTMFFSFTTEESIEVLFQLISKFNNNLETNNPIRAVVVPIEKYI